MRTCPSVLAAHAPRARLLTFAHTLTRAHAAAGTAGRVRAATPRAFGSLRAWLLLHMLARALRSVLWQRWRQLPRPVTEAALVAAAQGALACVLGGGDATHESLMFALEVRAIVTHGWT